MYHIEITQIVDKKFLNRFFRGISTILQKKVTKKDLIVHVVWFNAVQDLKLNGNHN